MYYLSNNFEVCAKSGEIEKARSWLDIKAEQCGVPLNHKSEQYDPEREDYLKFSLYFKSSTWKDIVHWLPLAKWAYETDLDTSYVCVTDTSHYLVLNALEEVVNLGVRARDRETPYEWLEDDFEDWAVAKVRLGTGIGWGRHGSWDTGLQLLEKKLGGRSD